MGAIRVGIVGYGNLGRGVEQAISLQKDLTVEAVFTRRDPQTVATLGSRVFDVSEILDWQERLDVLILCGGSRTDLPEQTPDLAKNFNVVDSYDNHAKIPDHFARVDENARAAKTVALISGGWDPGLFSLNRVLAESVIPRGETYTFWGRGLSQGHSDALRRVPGVADGVQYTIPAEEALEGIRRGETPELSVRDKHVRECFVVLADGADPDTVRKEIIEMPDYFAPYDTSVNFISKEELQQNHTGMPHGGVVIRSGETSPENKQTYEFKLSLQSNPEFTSSVLAAYTRAVWRLSAKGDFGAKTVFDIPVGLLSDKTPEELRKHYL